MADSYAYHYRSWISELHEASRDSREADASPNSVAVCSRGLDDERAIIRSESRIIRRIVM
jgi:hypothetical protein